MRSKHFLHWLLMLICITAFVPLISFSQNVGIGTNTPAFKLDVKNGSINTDSVYRIQGATMLSIKNGNLLIGAQAGASVTSGTYNLAVGHNSLVSNTTGQQNIALGTSTLNSNSTGSQNTAIGHFTLIHNELGSFNTAIGSSTMSNNTIGNYNCAFGYLAMVFNESGSNNTASGVEALYRNTIGNYNSATGHFALHENKDGSFNTATGVEALRNNTSGDFNSAHGYLALFSNQGGVQNTAIGHGAMFYNVSGGGNTAIGHMALGNNQGSYNVGVGYAVDVDAVNAINVIAIGTNTTVAASNTARFGNSSTISYGGWAGWTNVSDGRFKKNIKENVPGLDFINKLRPVTYNLDAGRLDKFYHKNRPATAVSEKENNAIFEKGLKEKEKIIYTGFVAQEVEAAAKQLGFDFSGVDAAKNENDTYGLRYAEFVVPLVKAVQEQQIMIDALKLQNELLEKRIALLENKN